MRDFAGRVVVITGAGSGIGRATALRFAREGARLWLADVDERAADETRELARHAAEAHVAAVDVGDASAMEEFAARVRTESRVPDVIVNNAGIGVAGPLLDTSLEQWRRLIDVNLWGVIHGCRLFAPMLVERRRGGHIVNVASAAAFGPSRVLPAYGTTKAAVLMLSECLRAELAPHGIGVSAVCPGLVNTNIVRTTAYVGGDAGSQAAKRSSAERMYRRRNYGPERVADRILTSIRENRAVVPVTVEAHAFRLVNRLSPALSRRIANLGPLGV